jgi:hypothetical protein
MFTVNDVVNSKKFWNVWKALQASYFCLTPQVLHLLRQFEVSLAFIFAMPSELTLSAPRAVCQHHWVQNIFTSHVHIWKQCTDTANCDFLKYLWNNEASDCTLERVFAFEPLWTFVSISSLIWEIHLSIVKREIVIYVIGLLSSELFRSKVKISSNNYFLKVFFTHILAFSRAVLHKEQEVL